MPLWYSHYMIFLSISLCFPSTLFSVSHVFFYHLSFLPSAIVVPISSYYIPKYWHFLLNVVFCVHISVVSFPLLRSFHWLPVNFRISLQISLLTSKTRHEKQSVYFHFMLATYSHSVHWDQTNESLCWLLRSRLTLVQGHFTLVLLLFGTTSLYLPTI